MRIIINLFIMVMEVVIKSLTSVPVLLIEILGDLTASMFRGKEKK